LDEEIRHSKMELNKIYQGDALEVLKSFPSGSVDCVVTSPPYWALRDYGVEGQLGLEPTFQEYINKLCDIFDEVKRVLKKEGNCWVNLGDTYSGSGNGSGDKTYKDRQHIKREKFDLIYKGQKAGKTELPDKCLIQIPSRFAIEMCDRGWVLRNEIVWHKPNCMPASVKDRFTVDFEKIFFFVKSKKYYFEQQLEPVSEISLKRSEYGWECYRPSTQSNNGIKVKKNGKKVRQSYWSQQALRMVNHHQTIQGSPFCNLSRGFNRNTN
jgi:site-specific DNA-methyltransferase (adenine-specific)